jgi:hypothetical protein
MVARSATGDGTSDGTREIKMSKCSCGRSPTGLCVGWHALTKEDYEKNKKEYEELPEKKKKSAFHVRAIDGFGE